MYLFKIRLTSTEKFKFKRRASLDRRNAISTLLVQVSFGGRSWDTESPRVDQTRSPGMYKNTYRFSLINVNYSLEAIILFIVRWNSGFFLFTVFTIWEGKLSYGPSVAAGTISLRRCCMSVCVYGREPFSHGF